MNGYSNSATWCVANIVNNDVILFDAVRSALSLKGDDIAVMHNSEDDGEFQDFFVPELAHEYETIVRNWSKWLRSNEIQSEFDEVNWGELAVAFAQDNFPKVGA